MSKYFVCIGAVLLSPIALQCVDYADKHDSNQSGTEGSSASKESVEISKGSSVAPQLPHSRKHFESIQLKGKNTFAVPRNVKPLGWTTSKPGTKKEEDEKPKSNDEFRKMFMKS
ncbi:squamous cell carcinoma antigen recognized by T-cells 3-like isoform X3 [Gossypium australe]|uniref:Squamous cell carcinoma antigen recognized by T-cells 3-like isoform X3 n=1 Tax=Gossypium australe TaxID=47621 RepID=A0A5B6WED0_9ROSI|nr:squamous cell carcinoma antigen recognized by T-cells 3-like isoform X3 [Gossypium australe]